MATSAYPQVDTRAVGVKYPPNDQLAGRKAPLRDSAGGGKK